MVEERKEIQRTVVLSWTRTSAEIVAYLPYDGHIQVTIYQDAPPTLRTRRDIVCLEGRDIDTLAAAVRKLRVDAEQVSPEAVS